jgi:hypothetical protein
MLLKFALYFFIAFAIQFLVLVLKTTDPEFGLTIAAICIAFASAFLAVFAVCDPEFFLLVSSSLFFSFLVLIPTFSLSKK